MERYKVHVFLQYLLIGFALTAVIGGGVYYTSIQKAKDRHFEPVPPPPPFNPPGVPADS